MGKPSDFLGEGPLCMIGNITGRLNIELPDFDTKEEWEVWFDELCDKHIVQTGKIRWEIVEDREEFLKNMGYKDDPDEDDLDAETPFDQFIFEL